jgi:hypothetical protein
MTKLPEVSDAEGHIHISRASRYLYSLARFKVLIDGEHRGRLWSGESLAFDVMPGHHTVELRMQLLRSPRLDVDVPPEQITFVCCDLGRFLYVLDYYYKVRRKGLTLHECEKPLLPPESRWPNQSGLARWRAQRAGGRRARALVERQEEQQHA